MSTTKASKPDFLGALTAGKFGAAGKATAVKTAALKAKAASAAGSRKKAKGSKPGDTHQFILKDTSGKSYLVDVWIINKLWIWYYILYVQYNDPVLFNLYKDKLMFL